MTGGLHNFYASGLMNSFGEPLSTWDERKLSLITWNWFMNPQKQIRSDKIDILKSFQFIKSRPFRSLYWLWNDWIFYRLTLVWFKRMFIWLSLMAYLNNIALQSYFEQVSILLCRCCIRRCVSLNITNVFNGSIVILNLQFGI